MVVPREDNLEIDKFEGLNVSSHPSLIKDKEFSRLENVQFGESGEVFRRTGLYAETDFREEVGWVNGQAVEFLGGFFSNTNDHNYLALVGGVPYRGDVIPQMTKITGFADTIECVGVVQYNDIWYFITSNDGVWKAAANDSSTATKIAGSPNAAAFLLFKDKLWLALIDPTTTSTLSSTLQWSESGNLDSWPPENIAKIASGNSDVITNLIPVGDRIIVFKKLSIWNVFTQGNDYPISAIRLLIRGRGAVSTKAVTVVNEMVYFIAHDGVWVTDGSAFSEISTPISDLFLGGPSTYAYDQTDYIMYFDDHLYVRLTAAIDLTPVDAHVSTRATNQGGSYYMVLHVPSASWAEEVYPSNIGHLTRPQPTRSNIGAVLLIQGSTDRIFNRSYNYWRDDISGDHFSDTAVGVPIPVVIQTKRFNVDRKTKVKRLKYMMLGMESLGSAPSMQYIVDGNPRDEFSFDPAAVDKYGSYMLPGCGYFRTFEFLLKDTSVQEFRLDFLHFILHLKRNQMESVQ